MESSSILLDDEVEPDRGTGGGTGSLAELGIDNFHESIYRSLLRERSSTVPELARSVSQPPHRVAAALATLRRLKFVNPDADNPDAWTPELPHIAVETLLMARQAALLQTRLVVPGLEREADRPAIGNDPEGSGIARLRGADPASQVRVYLQLQQQARRTVRIIARPPYLVSSPEHMSAERRNARERGVQFRSILDAESMTLPGWNDAIRAMLTGGEEIRVLGTLPFKLILADDDCALLPADLLDQRGDALVVHSTSLLCALSRHFENLWALAVPLVLDAAGEPAQQSRTEALDTALVTLLAAGGNDKSIAGQLGISHRTLMRRTNQLYATLNAHSRFQAGWLAARPVCPAQPR